MLAHRRSSDACLLRRLKATTASNRELAQDNHQLAQALGQLHAAGIRPDPGRASQRSRESSSPMTTGPAGHDYQPSRGLVEDVVADESSQVRTLHEEAALDNDRFSTTTPQTPSRPTAWRRPIFDIGAGGQGVGVVGAEYPFQVGLRLQPVGVIDQPRYRHPAPAAPPPTGPPGPARLPAPRGLVPQLAAAPRRSRSPASQQLPGETPAAHPRLTPAGWHHPPGPHPPVQPPAATAAPPLDR